MSIGPYGLIPIELFKDQALPYIFSQKQGAPLGNPECPSIAISKIVFYSPGIYSFLST